MNYRMTALAAVCLMLGMILIVPMAVGWLGAFAEGGWGIVILTTAGSILFLSVLAWSVARLCRRS